MKDKHFWRPFAWLAAIGTLAVATYATLAWVVLSHMPADFLVGDYVYELDEPRSDFPVASPIREAYFSLRGRERVISAMHVDALLRVLPLTLYLDVNDRFPLRRQRAEFVIASTFCGLSTDLQDAALARVRPSARRAELTGVTRCAEATQ